MRRIGKDRGKAKHAQRGEQAGESGLEAIGGSHGCGLSEGDPPEIAHSGNDLAFLFFFLTHRPNLTT
jgi:hypothetical protein